MSKPGPKELRNRELDQERLKAAEKPRAPRWPTPKHYAPPGECEYCDHRREQARLSMQRSRAREKAT